MALSKDDIVEGLRELGVTEGMVVMAHVALSAFGDVEGGADTVIRALAEAVGESGTLCMPAMSGEQPFDVETSASNVGAVTERFRSWPGVERGLHPTHSACCLGPMADELLRGHISQPTALGPESPWGRLARLPNGYVLLLGCDQDRNTLLHCAEEVVDAPYLKTIERDYLDEHGERHTKMLEKYPGPHRDFIGMDSLLREGGAMTVGKIGDAVCRLMHAGKSVELAIAALRYDPAAVLCNNPNCEDCVRQRANITRHRLSQEEFTLAAVVDEIGLPLDQLEEAVGIIKGQGIDTIEFGPELSAELLDMSVEQLGAVASSLCALDVRVSLVSCPQEDPSADIVRRVAEIAKALGAAMVKLQPFRAEHAGLLEELPSLVDDRRDACPTLVVENVAGTVFDTKANCEGVLTRAPGLKVAYNPAHFAHVGEKPFLQTYHKGKLKRALEQLYITDGCRPGGDPYTLPGQGQGEVKELMSILRCRSFDGVFCLKMADRTGKQEFIRQCRAFWHLMETL